MANLSRKVVSIVSRDNNALSKPGEKSLVDAILADTQMDSLQDTTHQALLAVSPQKTMIITSFLNSTDIAIRMKIGYSAESLPFIETVQSPNKSSKVGKLIYLLF